MYGLSVCTAGLREREDLSGYAPSEEFIVEGCSELGLKVI